MRIRSANTAESYGTDLLLRININCAADLIPPTQKLNNSIFKGSRSVNPVCVVRLNETHKKTSRQLNTAKPSWNSELTVPLHHGDYTQVLVLTVWDKHKRHKHFLGELRLPLTEIFCQDNFRAQTDLKWYKLYCNRNYKTFVTGSVLASFELTTRPRKRRPRKNPSPVPVIRVEGREVELPSSGNSSSTSLNDLGEKRPKIKQLFEEWVNSLAFADKDLHVVPDDQGFYSDSNEGATDISDIDSIASSRPSTEKTEKTKSGLSKENTDPDSAEEISIDEEVSIDESEDELIDEGSEEGSLEEAGASEKDTNKSSKRRWLRRTAQDNFSVANRKVSGVIFVEIESCSDLPPLSNFTRTSFDMDPFVVVTFGRKTFRTSWKHHTLNPVFNERLAFEVLSHEVNFNVQFQVLDKDHFSYHDDVASVSLPLQELIGRDINEGVRAGIEMKRVRENREENTEEEEKEKKKEEEEKNTEEKKEEKKKEEEEKEKEKKEEKKKEEEEEEMETEKTDTDPLSKLSHDFEMVSLDPDDSAKSFPSSKGELSSASDSGYMSPITVVSDNMVSIKKKKFRRQQTQYADTSRFRTLNLRLKLEKEKYAEKYNPTLKVRVHFQTYGDLRRQFWRAMLEQYSLNEDETSKAYDFMELILLLDTLGCHDSDDVVAQIFTHYGRSSWGGDLVTHEEIIEALEAYVQDPSKNEHHKIFEIERCPVCLKKRLSKKDDVDIVTHFAICASKDWSIVNKLLVSSYVTPQLATKRWFSKFLIKLTYGKYKLGSNSANILVQDRLTGLIMEEKMGIYVRLGIRLLYKGLDKAKTKRIRILLRRLSVKQGIKFDAPSSRHDIDSFIKFHKLNLDDCLEQDPSKYATFNEFFYRRLKPGARPIDAPSDPRIVSSPADCRCAAFASVERATEFWIKGRNFTVSKLFGGDLENYENTTLLKADKCSLGIFRLAPQDYHRFHSPVDGVVGKVKYISGEYYTVNPMAIRSELDVFGENVRVIIPIETKDFGTVMMIAVGAMMVGSTVLTVGEGQQISRGDEVGYFKFGGSTIILLFESRNFRFDSDLINNSTSSIETLIRVGQSVGHHVDVPEFQRDHVDFEAQSKDFKKKLIRVLTGGDVGAKDVGSWEVNNLLSSELEQSESEELIKHT